MAVGGARVCIKLCPLQKSIIFVSANVYFIQYDTTVAKSRAVMIAALNFMLSCCRILRPEVRRFPVKKRMTLTAKILRLEKSLGVECGREVKKSSSKKKVQW